VVEWGLFWDWPTVGMKSKSGASGSSISGIRDGLSFRLGRRKTAALTLEVWVSRSYICLLASKSAVAALMFCFCLVFDLVFLLIQSLSTDAVSLPFSHAAGLADTRYSSMEGGSTTFLRVWCIRDIFESDIAILDHDPRFSH